MRMPFGKYKGHQVQCLPSDYMVWLWMNIDLDMDLWRAVSEGLAANGIRLVNDLNGDSFEEDQTTSPSQENIEAIIKRLHRKYAQKFHPDVNPNISHEVLGVVNSFVAELRKELERAA